LIILKESAPLSVDCKFVIVAILFKFAFISPS